MLGSRGFVVKDAMVVRVFAKVGGVAFGLIRVIRGIIRSAVLRIENDAVMYCTISFVSRAVDSKLTRC